MSTTRYNQSMTTTTKTIAPSAPVCDGDHWMKTKDGRFQWCMPDECIVHGTGAER